MVDDTHDTRARTWLGLLGAGALISLLAATGCGGDDTTSGTASGTDTGTTDATDSDSDDSTTAGPTESSTDPSGSDSDSETTGDGDGDGLCGNGVIDDGELCDDGLNDGSYGGCQPECLALAAYCGDAEVNGPETCDDGVNDGAYNGCEADCTLAAFCGDAEINGPEVCDDGNGDLNDGCLTDCSVPDSCLTILNYDGNAPDGVYNLDPDLEGPIAPFDAFCDMTTDGGGWTEITLELACSDVLGGALVAEEPAPTEGIDMMCRPFTQDTNGKHTYHYTFMWPPTYQDFYLQDYKLKANGLNGSNTSDIYPGSFVQSVWTAANAGSGWGDVSFGTAAEPGPTTSFSEHLMNNFDCFDCELDWPATNMIFSNMAPSDTFRIGFGEAGGQSEGWYPWWSGTIRLR